MREADESTADAWHRSRSRNGKQIAQRGKKAEGRKKNGKKEVP